MKPWSQVTHFALRLCLGLSLSAGIAQGAAARNSVDGPTGEPDFWRVTNLCLSRRPALRDAPSHQAKWLAYPANGAIVKNHGCKSANRENNSAHNEKWCRIETTAEPKTEGWIVRNCLRAAPH
jgi:hypothetical protein